MKLLISLSIGLIVIASSVYGHQNGPKVGQRTSTNLALGNCESNAATLDASHQLAGEDGLIIAIGRLGDGESSRELSRRRLQMVRKYLTRTPWRKPADTIILAEGERTHGHGRVELYIGGKLFQTLLADRNRNLLVYSCGG